jgi:hypothetical protein
MKIRRARKPLVALLTMAFSLAASIGLAQTTGTTGSTEAEKVPPSTNPANRVIYPAQGQDANQQMQDQLESYRWATRQTGWDPYEAHDVLVQKGYVAAQTAEQAQGGLVRGAARGALAGLAIGAIAGDAGKGAAIGAAAGGLTGGMRSRRQRQAAQSAADQAIHEFESRFEVWDRNWVASMQGRGYTIQ